MRGEYEPVTGDFDANGTTDILWYGAGDAPDSMWLRDPWKRQFIVRPTTVHGTYRPIAGDFDGDGYGDIFWYGPGPAPDSVHYSTGFGFNPRKATVNGYYVPVT